MTNKKEQFYLALQHIPAGFVVTYGDLAQLAGFPKAARLAGKILHDLPQDSVLPWHRVVNASGKISLPEGSPAYLQQVARLEAEGVHLSKGKLNLRKFRWHLACL